MATDRRYRDTQPVCDSGGVGLQSTDSEKRQSRRIKKMMKNMPFDVQEYLEFDMPGSDAVGDRGN